MLNTIDTSVSPTRVQRSEAEPERLGVAVKPQERAYPDQRWFDRAGNQITQEQSEAIEKAMGDRDPESLNPEIARTVVGEAHVITSFLGHDYTNELDRPYVYEQVVVTRDDEGRLCEQQLMDHFPNPKEALEAHAFTVAALSDGHDPMDIVPRDKLVVPAYTMMPEQQIASEQRAEAEPERLGVAVIGEFVQAKQQTMADKDDHKLTVAAGKYPVVGAVDRDGQVKSAGIIFDAVDPQSGKLKNVIEFRGPDELAKMAQRGSMELAEGVTLSMLGVKPEQKQEQKQSQKQSQKHGLRV